MILTEKDNDKIQAGREFLISVGANFEKSPETTEAKLQLQTVITCTASVMELPSIELNDCVHTWILFYYMVGVMIDGKDYEKAARDLILIQIDKAKEEVANLLEGPNGYSKLGNHNKLH